MTLYTVMVYLHIMGALGFFAAHGTGIAVLFALQRERNAARIQAMLDLSASTRTPTYVSLLILTIAGTAAGFAAGFWSQGWMSLSVVLLAIQLGLGMFLIPYFRKLRRVLNAAANDSTGHADALDRVLRERRPGLIALSEAVLISATVWLMVAKPL